MTNLDHHMSLLNRRRAPRFPFHSRGSLLVAEMEHGGTVMDISSKGILFASGNPIGDVVGRACRLNVIVGEQPGCLELDGIVVHQNERFTGIRFLELSEASRKGLEQIIEMNLGHPSLLDRDLPSLCRPSGQ